jgi:hypothetical protein
MDSFFQNSSEAFLAQFEQQSGAFLAPDAGIAFLGDFSEADFIDDNDDQIHDKVMAIA